MRFTVDDIAPMARGAAVLGGGAAGEPFLAEAMLGEVLRANESIEIIGLDELDDDADVAPFALTGSPHALSEKLLGTVEPPILFADNTLRSRTLSAVMPYEMAGLNALCPLAAAGLPGVACVDGDVVGRGVPSLDLTTLELDGAQPDSYLLCDPNRRTVTIRKSGALSVERLVRPVAETMGRLAVLPTSSPGASFCRAHALRGSVSRCSNSAASSAGCRRSTKRRPPRCWRSERGLRLAGPRALGYGIDYVDFSIAAGGGSPR